MKYKFKQPMTPNFIITTDEIAIPIGEFSDKALETIGKMWIKELIKKAKKRRNESGVLIK